MHKKINPFNEFSFDTTWVTQKGTEKKNYIKANDENTYASLKKGCSKTYNENVYLV